MMELQKIYRRRAVESFSGMKHSALYTAIAANKFPKPIRVTERCVGWLESDLLAWQAARIAERDEKSRETPSPTATGASRDLPHGRIRNTRRAGIRADVKIRE